MIRRASQLRPHDRDAVAAIYTDSFPPEQQAPTADLFASELWLATNGDDGDTEAFASISDLKSVRCALLAYLAVRRDRRGQGIGRAVLDAITADLQASGWCDHIVLEVEPVRTAGRTDDVRRIRFYEQWGAGVVDGAKNYRMPNLDGPGAVPMWIMAYDLTDDPLRSEEVHEVVRAIWVEGYGRAVDDIDLVTLLTALS